MEESKLIFSLDDHDEGPTVVFSRDRPPRDRATRASSLIDLDLSHGPRPQPPFLPLSPSSPGSLADLSAAADLLVTPNLVKSCSTDMEPGGEAGSLKGRPLLSLVKSLSTEISRRVEPEVNLSKSDSKLHLHPWKQLTHPRIPEARPKALGGLGETDGAASPPPSAGSLSPTEPRGSSLIAELEDTRRKFSVAMQDQLSMLSKIMGDESPKQGRACPAGDPWPPQGACGRDWSGEDLELKCRRRPEGDRTSAGVCEASMRRTNKASSTKPPVPAPRPAPVGEKQPETRPYRDVVPAVGAVWDGSRRRIRSRSRGPALPLHWLFPVGLLAYGFFVLPLPPYVTGLSVGVASGFFLGLVVVFVFAPRRSTARRNSRLSRTRTLSVDSPEGRFSDSEFLEGWMNETHAYDPETFHPSVTHSVHVGLEGGRLRLAYPRSNAPRWAAFDEAPHDASFLRLCTYQLENCKVSLVPPGLARKRLWNKKYPICLTLAEGEVGEEESVVDGPEDDERPDRPDPNKKRTPVVLFLFGRTGREKEEWFQHFLRASRGGAASSVSSEDNADTPCGGGGDSVRDGVEEQQGLAGLVRARTLLDYSAYMTQLIGGGSCPPTPSPCPSEQDSPTTQRKIPSEEPGSRGETGAESEAGGCSVGGQPSWVNSLVGRIFWDFLQEKYWTDQVAHKIQKKLSKIKLPYFMNELTLVDLDMGTCLPQVLSTSRPTLDRRGLWLELELVYTGCLQMTLETKMNLCKLGKDGEDEAQGVPEALQLGSKPRLSVLADSDEESSSAGSSDEDDVPPTELQGAVGEKSSAVAADGHAGGSTGRKILRFVDKIAKSKYFQKATENEYIKKKIAEVSNMPLNLSVEVLELSGTLAVNIPPPPTDRIWYSFRVPPRLDLHVRPMLGVREVTFTHVTEWIEKKLVCEFQKVFVMPNMDDLYLPLMTSGLEAPPPSCHSSVQSSSHQSSMESQDYLSE